VARSRVSVLDASVLARLAGAAGHQARIELI
jgi:hypothetical protein